jgi:hypothetical protein
MRATGKDWREIMKASMAHPGPGIDLVGQIKEGKLPEVPISILILQSMNLVH